MSPKELLTLIITIPLFLFISNLFPQIQTLFITSWILNLSLDIYTTYIFYRENPNQFQNNERNKLFIWLTKKFNFKKAAILFPLTIEIPLLLFLTTLPLQTLQTHMFPTTPNNPLTCLTTSFGISAISHLQAAHKNNKHNNNNKTNQKLSH